jgi:hypothetical protein
LWEELQLRIQKDFFIILKKIGPLTKAFILSTGSEFRSVTNPAIQKIDSDDRNWNYLELPTTHIPQVAMPAQLNKILIELAKLNK